MEIFGAIAMPEMAGSTMPTGAAPTARGCHFVSSFTRVPSRSVFLVSMLVVRTSKLTVDWVGTH